MALEIFPSCLDSRLNWSLHPPLPPPHHVQRHRLNNSPRKVRRIPLRREVPLSNRWSVCSGTNGYVQRNLSHLRPRDDSYNRTQDFSDIKGPRMREPDQGILDHEKARQMELKVFELQVELEDEG